MIILQDTNDLLQIKLSGAVATNQLPFVASYVDTTSTSFSPLQNNGTTNGGTAVTLVASPVASTQRTVKYVSVHNADTTTATITIQLSDNSTIRTICTYTLSAGDRLEYTDTVGWRVLNSSGAIKQTTSVGTDTIPATQVTTDSSNRFVTDTQISNFQSAYNNAVLANGGATVAVTFNTSKYYGTVSSPLSGGSITYNFTNAVAGSKAIIFHNAGAEPTYPVGTYKRFGTYVPSALNILTFEFIDSNTVLLDVTYSSTAGLQPEVVTWLSKGGVATGFVLTALNQFMLDIASIRSRILRMNVMIGETFASMFIPIIVNDDGSATPLGGALDSNTNFVSGDWTFIGANGGLFANSTSNKYIQSPFVPNDQALFGLNDASFGMYNILTSVASNTPTNMLGGGSTLGISVTTAGNSSTIALNGVAVNLGINYTSKYLIASRNNNANFDYYLNGIKTTVTSASTSKSTSAVYNGVPLNPSTIRLIGGYFLGKSIDATQEATLRSAWGTLHAKLGHS